MDLSIIIPTYNEAHKISRDIIEAGAFLRHHHLQGEILVADDGSVDGTAAMAREAGKGLTLHVLENETHHGKGYVVRQGMMAAQGRIIMFSDSGACTPYDFAAVGMDLIERDQCDCAHGSRKMRGSVIRHPQPLNRRIISMMIRWVFILWLKVPARLTDTQCGFKLYRGSAAKTLYADCETKGFLFDVEIILRARQHNLRIIEFPIEWRADRDSRLSASRNFFGILRELYDLKQILRRPAKKKPTGK